MCVYLFIMVCFFSMKDHESRCLLDLLNFACIYFRDGRANMAAPNISQWAEWNIIRFFKSCDGAVQNKHQHTLQTPQQNPC